MSDHDAHARNEAARARFMEMERAAREQTALHADSEDRHEWMRKAAERAAERAD